MRTFLLLATLGGFSQSTSAQGSVSGYVFDVTTGKPLSNVEIVSHDGVTHKSTFSSPFGRYAIDSLSIQAHSILGILRTKVSGNWIQFVLQSNEVIPEKEGLEVHFGFSIAQLEAFVYSTSFESK